MKKYRQRCDCENADRLEKMISNQACFSPYPIPFLVSIKPAKPCSSNFFTQASNVDRQGVIIDEKVAIPEFPHQVITRHDIASMFKQYSQNLKFILGQTQDFP